MGDEGYGSTELCAKGSKSQRISNLVSTISFIFVLILLAYLFVPTNTFRIKPKLKVLCQCFVTRSFTLY